MSFLQLLPWWIHFSHEALPSRESASAHAVLSAQEAVQHLSKTQVPVSARSLYISSHTCTLPELNQHQNEECRALVQPVLMAALK